MAQRRLLRDLRPWLSRHDRERGRRSERDLERLDYLNDGTLDEMERLLPPDAQPTYVPSSHDAPRHRSRFDDPKFGAARARLSALMLLTLRGTPFLYYGEEIGMRDVTIPDERIQDPVDRRLPGLGRDPERTPMQWSAEENAGFSSVGPWLPIADDYAACNVARQLDDPASLLSFHRKVVWYRKTAPALLRGTYRAVESPSDTLVYLREDGARRLMVAINFADEARPVPLSRHGIDRLVHRTFTK